MTNDILYILAISCGAIIWVKALPFIYWVKLFIMTYKQRKEFKPLKPFDCESCLSFWGSSIYLVATSHTIPETLAIACVAYIFTALLTKLI